MGVRRQRTSAVHRVGRCDLGCDRGDRSEHLFHVFNMSLAARTCNPGS